jgi:hypothetical protein
MNYECLKKMLMKGHNRMKDDAVEQFTIFCSQIFRNMQATQRW